MNYLTLDFICIYLIQYYTILMEINAKGDNKMNINKNVVTNVINLSKKVDYSSADCQKAEKELSDYLNSLDFETVKNLQTLMYLGRDEDYSKNDSFEERFYKYREYFDKRDWNTQEIEVGQMTEKAPLAEYLENGMKIVGI